MTLEDAVSAQMYFWGFGDLVVLSPLHDGLYACTHIIDPTGNAGITRGNVWTSREALEGYIGRSLPVLEDLVAVELMCKELAR